jgi:hypothetical protein
LTLVWDRLASGMRKKWSGPTPTEHIRLLREVIQMQRLVLGKPMATEQSRFQVATGNDSTGTSDAAPGQTNEDDFSSRMTPEFFAEVLRILEKHGALGDELDRESTSSAPTPNSGLVDPEAEGTEVCE